MVCYFKKFKLFVKKHMSEVEALAMPVRILCDLEVRLVFNLLEIPHCGGSGMGNHLPSFRWSLFNQSGYNNTEKARDSCKRQSVSTQFVFFLGTRFL